MVNPDLITYEQNRFGPNEQTGSLTDPLALDIDDLDLCRIIDDRIRASRHFYEEHYDLYEKRKKNEIYRFGRQIDEIEKADKYKSYETRTLDNVLYEIERTMKPLALSQLPDLIVSPGQDTDQSKTLAELMTKVVNSDLQQEQNRKVLAMAWSHRPVYRIGVIKCIWNPQAFGGLGDYEFIYVHPDAIDLDHTATESDADKMQFVSHKVEMKVSDVIMRFPKAKDKFIRELRKYGVLDKNGHDTDAGKWRAMATPVYIREVWFTDYEQAEKEDGRIMWKRVEGVLWKYKDCILEKMKNPYFDYTGEKQVFTYDDPRIESSKRKITLDEMQDSLMTGQYPGNISEEQVYRNFFDAPKKPFFFMTYDQWGKQPLDETTHLEQNLANQDNLDFMQKQIQDTLKNRGHWIWSKTAGLSSADIKKMDHNNPDEDYLVTGDPNAAYKYEKPDRPAAQEYQDIDRLKNTMYELASATSIRGEVQDEAVTNNQIGRESNYTVIDDMVEETINKAAQWIAGWAMHMIKTRYTQAHFRKILGAKGEWIFMQLHQDFVEDGQAVMIKASGSDKLRKQNNAMNMAKMKMIDPLSFFEDMDMDDPEGRTARLITSQADGPLYLSEFVETAPTATTQLAQKLAALTQQQQNQQSAPGGQPSPNGPAGPSTNNTQAIAANPPQGQPAMQQMVQ
ncbi:MAG TPA: hypothetical protein VF941_02925 [Clostridia bacterium]